MMTRTVRTAIVAAALAFTAAVTSAEERVQATGQKYLGPVHAFQHVDVSAQVDRLDERIAMLTADMRMFVGELKIQAMAELIEALIERQHLIESRMRPMDRMIDEWMPHAPPARPHAVPDGEEGEPEAMCSPYI